MPITTSAIIAGTAGLAQAGTGVAQMIQANKYRKKKRPTYEIPLAEEEALKNARAMAAQTRLPGQDIIEQGIGASTAGGVKTVIETGQSPSQILNSVSNIYGNEMQQKNQLGVQAANFQQGNRMNLQGELKNYAQFQEKKFDINEMQPYEAAMAAAAALSGAGQQNIAGGITSMAGTGMNYAANSPGKTPPTKLGLQNTGGGEEARPMTGYNAFDTSGLPIQQERPPSPLTGLPMTDEEFRIFIASQQYAPQQNFGY